jgi:hypothetical protein
VADAGICCWAVKYTYQFWRPITAIQQAGADGNPLTVPDASWAPLLVTPPFPSYTSGHSTFSGAASTVLTAFFGDHFRFTTTSDSMPGVTRSFNSFADAADEAGISRIYGGIHYLFDNVNALSAGRAIGDYVANNFLKPLKGHGGKGHQHDGPEALMGGTTQVPAGAGATSPSGQNPRDQAGGKHSGSDGQEHRNSGSNGNSGHDDGHDSDDPLNVHLEVRL